MRASLLFPLAEKETRRKGVRDIPGPWPSLPVLGTRWIYSLGVYKMDKIHEAYKGELLSIHYTLLGYVFFAGFYTCVTLCTILNARKYNFVHNCVQNRT